jgi:hypothetical protein
MNVAKLPAFQKLVFTMLTQELIGFASSVPELDYGAAAHPPTISGRGLFWLQVGNLSVRHEETGENETSRLAPPLDERSGSCGDGGTKEAIGNVGCGSSSGEGGSGSGSGSGGGGSANARVSDGVGVDGGGSIGDGGRGRPTPRPSATELLTLIECGVDKLSALIVDLVSKYCARHNALRYSRRDAVAAASFLAARIRARPRLHAALAVVRTSLEAEFAEVGKPQSSNTSLKPTQLCRWRWKETAAAL